MKKSSKITIIMLAVVTMFACTHKLSDKKTESTPSAVAEKTVSIEGVQLYLTSFAEGDVLPEGSFKTAYIMLNAEEKTFAGTTSCNRIFGSYKLDGNSISFANTGATKMMCEPASMSIEDKMLPVINTANRYEVVGQNVIFFKDAERLAEFAIEMPANN